MAQEIRAACLFVCLCQSVLHQMVDLFDVIISKVLCMFYRGDAVMQNVISPLLQTPYFHYFSVHFESTIFQLS